MSNFHKSSEIRDPRRFSSAEQEARVELAAFYRAIAAAGLDDSIYNHISLRLPEENDHFLINSYGMLYEEMTASSLFKIDLDGNIVHDPGNGFGINRAGFVIHSAIHAARHDLTCIIHTHSRASVAVSSMKCGLLPVSQQACALHGKIAYHSYEGPSVDLEERRRLVADLGDCKILILRNHGLLVGGINIAETFFQLHLLESACRIQVDLMVAGTDLIVPSEEIVRRTARVTSDNPDQGRLEWLAMQRKLDRQDASFRN